MAQAGLVVQAGVRSPALDGIALNQIPLVQFPFLVEKLKEWAAGCQHSPMGQELGTTNHHSAVTKETLRPLLPQALKQLLTVFWELHSTPRREGCPRKFPNSGSQPLLPRSQPVPSSDLSNQDCLSRPSFPGWWFHALVPELPALLSLAFQG